MAQIVVRQIPEAVHAALRTRAKRLGVSAEALVRDILAETLLPEGRPGDGLGDRLAAIWEGADLDGVSVGRDGDAPSHAPMRFE